MALFPPFRPVFSARKPPPSYQAGWVISEFQKVQAALVPTGSRLVTGESPAKDRVIGPSDVLVVVDATTAGGDLHLTLPDPVKSEGLLVTIKKIDLGSNSVVLDGYLVDGTTWILALPWQVVTVQAAQGQWYLIAQN